MMRRPVTGLALLVVATITLGGAGAAVAEEPLDELVRWPPGVSESRREPMGVVDFLVQEAGAAAGDVVEAVSITPERDGRGEPGAAVTVMRGHRFVDAAAAERAVATLAARGVGTVRRLGETQGEGFVVSLPEDVTTVHEAFRVRGRDLFVFTLVEIGTDDLPSELVEVVRWHAAAYPGSTAPLPDDSPASRWVLLAVGAVLAVAALAAVVRRRRGRRRPPAGPVPRWESNAGGWSVRPSSSSPTR